MDIKEFERDVERALGKIDQKFRDMMDNITIEVDPERIIYDESHHLILGHYIGVPLPKRGPAYQNVLPDKIIIYKQAFNNYPPEELPGLIANVLQHEIGHYFGLSEEELAKYKRT